ncbi:hypothetical protein ACLKMY_20260 [Paraburkholderia mimosarum]|uniref:hypothetical protein n=1 Tax=Paraburkholderia mimosarum TaxID=312026 RepID=UPI0039C3369B
MLRAADRLEPIQPVVFFAQLFRIAHQLTGQALPRPDAAAPAKGNAQGKATKNRLIEANFISAPYLPG